MRKLFLVLAGVVALSVPAASLAGNTPPGPKKLAVQTCKQTRAQMRQSGKHLFKQTYHSFAACLNKGKSQAKQDLSNARQTCKTERSDPNFGDTHDGKSFNDYYGTNTQAHGKGAGKNAFGKCVSMYAKQNAHDNASAAAAAAKECKTERSDPNFATDYGSGQSFNDYYGSNSKAKGNGKNKNAFGKCVSQNAKASHA